MTFMFCFFLALYFGASTFLLVFVKDEKDRIYILHHPFGGLMIFLFGPIIAAALHLVPSFRKAARAAIRAKKKVPRKSLHCCGAQGFGEPGDTCPGCEERFVRRNHAV
ncbi:hypothetical protein LCGC14_1119030 [marine sediment metagenome]|uniref:Uncharacterized protein n=1 Tax=marine sediment metagenome TaxID=412755 RepID=A0A0F9M9E5_9ZZZZ